MIKLQSHPQGIAVMHIPDGHKQSTILIAPNRVAAQNVMNRLNASGVDWSQPHTKENHAAMRAAVMSATSDGNVTTEELDK